MNSLQKITGLALVAWIGFVLALIYGWVCNLIDIIGWTGTVTGEFIVRVIGVFVPIIGAVMGWFA